MCNPACHFLKSGQWSGFDADEGMERLLLGVLSQAAPYAVRACGFFGPNMESE
jgi:hypothetical protein